MIAPFLICDMLVSRTGKGCCAVLDLLDESSRSAGALVSSLQRRNVMVAGRRTSMRLERAMWRAAEEVARREGLTVDDICTIVNRNRVESSLTSSVRVYLLTYFWELAERLLRDRADQGPV